MSKEELVRPDTDNCTDKEWNRWYWGAFNEVCLTCKNKCKQSHVVSLSCTQYIKIEEKNV